MHDPVWLVTLIAIAVVCCLWFGSEPVRYLAGAVIIVGARPMWVTVHRALTRRTLTRVVSALIPDRPDTH